MPTAVQTELLDARDVETVFNDAPFDAPDELGDAPTEIRPVISQTGLQFPVTAEKIAAVGKQYTALVISGLDDKAGFDQVHEARMIVKRTRIGVEKRRKELNDEAQQHIKRVNGAAKELAAALEPIETDLEQKENAVTEAKEKIKQAEQEAARLKAEAEARAIREAQEKALREEREATERKLSEERAALEQERKQLEAARKQQEAEAAERQRVIDEANAAERRRLADIAAAQQAEADKLAAEKKRLADAEAERVRKIESDRLAKEEAERVAAEEKRDQERREILKAQDVARLEALKPDIEKVRALGPVLRSLSMPSVQSEEALALTTWLAGELARLARRCEAFGA